MLIVHHQYLSCQSAESEAEDRTMRPLQIREVRKHCSWHWYEFVIRIVGGIVWWGVHRHDSNAARADSSETKKTQTSSTGLRHCFSVMLISFYIGVKTSISFCWLWYVMRAAAHFWTTTEWPWRIVRNWPASDRVEYRASCSTSLVNRCKFSFLKFHNDSLGAASS